LINESIASSIATLENPCADRTVEKLARNHRAGGQVEQRLTRLGELLCGRHSPESVPGSRQLRSDAVAPLVALQAQSQAAQGRDLSTILIKAPSGIFAAAASGAVGFSRLRFAIPAAVNLKTRFSRNPNAYL
jgi:hypothetical protein